MYIFICSHKDIECIEWGDCGLFCTVFSLIWSSPWAVHLFRAKTSRRQREVCRWTRPVRPLSWGMALGGKFREEITQQTSMHACRKGNCIRMRGHRRPERTEVCSWGTSDIIRRGSDHYGEAGVNENFRKRHKQPRSEQRPRDAAW